MAAMAEEETVRALSQNFSFVSGAALPSKQFFNMKLAEYQVWSVATELPG